jgi:predicted transcriptional regulator
MEAWLATALERYEALVREDLALDRQHQEISMKKKKNESDLEDVKRYLRAGLADPTVKADFERIARLKKELTGRNGNRHNGGPNKTHVMLDVLQKHGQTGLDLSEIMALLIPYNLGINRNYVGTVLRKLQKNRRMVARQGKKYFLTETGRTMKLSI